PIPADLALTQVPRDPAEGAVPVTFDDVLRHGMAPGPFAGPQAQQAAREVNTASLCRIGQETVQDIVYRTMEIFQLLRNMQKLPNGVTYHTGTYQDRLAKLQDHLRQLSILFRKLRLVYDKCNENCGGMDPIPQLIPYVEDDGSKNDDRAGPPRFASEERREIAEVNKKLKQKNQQLKQIMDQLRNLIWDINAMLAMRN
ncbi:hypothetical protein EI555_019831, partial [Monodon monoceros]